MNMNELVVIHSENPRENTAILGKMLYLTLGSVLVEKKTLIEIGEKIGLIINPKRNAITDAFMSATGDIYDRPIEINSDGTKTVSKIYVRDNERKQKDIISRELVRETLGAKTNQYEKLGNMVFNKKELDLEIDIFEHQYQHYEKKIRNLFDLYQRCYSKVQIETIVENYVNSLESSKISIHGRLYFVPRHTMDRVALLETLVEEIAEANLNKEYGNITINSMYVTNDEKQRGKMEDEFYANIGKEIDYYQQQLKRLIDSGKESEKIINRWLSKLDALYEKKKNYESLFNKQLDKLSDEFDILGVYATELRIKTQKGLLRLAG